MTPRKLANRDRFVVMYRGGARVDEICRVFSVARSTVKTWRRVLGLPARPRGWVPADFSAVMSAARRASISRFR